MSDHQEIGRIVSAMSPATRLALARWIATKEAGRVEDGSAAYYAWNRVHHAIDEAANARQAKDDG